MVNELEELQTPALLIHLDRARRNIARTLELCGGAARWRPHVKTCKVPEVLSLLLTAGVRQFKVATTREAEVLLSLAAEPIDVLVAMSHHGANLQRVASLARQHGRHRLSMLTEAPEHARQAVAAGLSVWIDLDPGWGRSGIPLAERPRIAEVVAAAGPALRGLHCYEGHFVADAPKARAEAAAPIHRELCALARSLGVRSLVTSGTPGFLAALGNAEFAEFEHVVSPGTVVYWDARSAELGIDGFAPAVEVLARVVSRPSATQLTVDAGSKAIDAASGDPVAVAVGDWQLRTRRPSEEHLPIDVRAGAAPELGSLLRLVPRHVCPTVNLADEAVLLENGDVVGIVPVRARGHETRLPNARV